MHFYFVDPNLNNHRWGREIARIETRVSDLGIKGKFARLTQIHRIDTCIADAIAQGAQTLVSVGNDQFLSRIVSFLSAHPGLTIGMIPLGHAPFNFSRSLGIKESMAACDSLAARRTEMLDMGIINARELFISSVDISSSSCTLECDRQYSLADTAPMHAAVQNFISYRYPFRADSPTDGRFTVRMTSPRPSTLFIARTPVPHTSIHAHTIRILPHRDEQNTVMVDGFRLVQVPLTIEIRPRHLFFIVGKGRIF